MLFCSEKEYDLLELYKLYIYYVWKLYYITYLPNIIVAV